MDQPKIDLRPDHWAIVHDILGRHVPDRAIWAFGSRATWTAKESSDLDLAILGDSPLPLATVAALEEDFAESDLPFKVDVVDWNLADPTFRDIIEADHVSVARSNHRKIGSWRIFLLGDVAEIYDGPHATPAKTEDGPVFLGISNLENGRLNLSEVEHLSDEDYARWIRRIAPQTGDVVFSYETRLGEAAQIPAGLKCCLGRRMGLLRARTDRVDPRFLLYAYLGPQFQDVIRSRTIPGSTVDRIPLIEMPDFPIVLPQDISDQRAIAHILGTLDDKIDLNRRMNATLEAMARALFKSWFVDFDPVRAKAEGRDTGLPPEIAALFPDSFEESEVGEVPRGWAIGKLDDIVAVNPTRSLRKGDIAPYLDMANMPETGHVPDDVIDRPYGSGMKFVNGDTLVARITPCLENGKTAFVDFLEQDQIAWGSTEYIVLRSKAPLPLEFSYLLARSDQFREFAIQSMTGSSGRQRVSPDMLRRFAMAIPSKVVAEVFGEVTHRLLAQCRSNSGVARTLAELRDKLLPRLISGDLGVMGTGRLSEGPLP